MLNEFPFEIMHSIQGGLVNLDLLESNNGCNFVIDRIVGSALLKTKLPWMTLLEALVEKDPSLKSLTLHRSVKVHVEVDKFKLDPDTLVILLGQLSIMLDLVVSLLESVDSVLGSLLLLVLF